MSSKNKDWYTGNIKESYGQAAVLLGITKQSIPRFHRIEDTLIELLGIDPTHIRFQGTLESALDLKGLEFSDSELVNNRVRQRLPDFSSDKSECISFQRLKDPARFQQKLETTKRDTYDTFGMQKFVDPDVIIQLQELDRPKHPLRKALAEKGITVKIDNHYAAAKPHGYRAVHINCIRDAKKNRDGSMEMQFLTKRSLKNYIGTRNVYEAYRALKETIELEKGENQNNWDDDDRFLVYSLRKYIKAWNEADAYDDGLMYLNNEDKVKPEYGNADEARQAMETLRPVALDVSRLFYSYEKDPVALLGHKFYMVNSLRERYALDEPYNHPNRDYVGLD